MLNKSLQMPSLSLSSTFLTNGCTRKYKYFHPHPFQRDMVRKNVISSLALSPFTLTEL